MAPRILLLALLLSACTDSDKDPPADTDTDAVIDPDPETPDLDGTFGTATDVVVDLDGTDVGVPQELGSDALDPAGDNDFYTVELSAGAPYHLWVDTGANLLCDTVLRIYPPGATTPAGYVGDPEDRQYAAGDLLAANDDMIYRYSGSDPAILFVPPTSGRYYLEVLEYGESIDDEVSGGSACTYAVKGMRRQSAEIECNDTFEVRAALVAGSGVDTGGGLSPTLTSPAVQPLGDNLFQPMAEEFTGWLGDNLDDDVWRYRFGELPGPGGTAWWLWSLWPTDTGSPIPPRRLTLLDDDLQVLAQTDAAIPDGKLGFVQDPAILYAVRSNSTYYLRVSEIPADPELDTAAGPVVLPAAPTLGTSDDPEPPGPSTKGPLSPMSGEGPGTGTYYVGVSHGYGPGLVACDGDPDQVTWWEAESLDDSTNDELGDAEQIAFCKIGTTDVYTSYIAGYLEPDGRPFRFHRQDAPEDSDAPDPVVELACGGQYDCADREFFAIRRTSGTGSIGGRRITISVQASTVGSFVQPEIYLFKNSEDIYPVAWTPGPTPTAEAQLSEGDAVLQTVLPTDADVVYILIQASALHPTRTEANSWFMRVTIDPPPGEGEGGR